MFFNVDVCLIDNVVFKFSCVVIYLDSIVCKVNNAVIYINIIVDVFNNVVDESFYGYLFWFFDPIQKLQHSKNLFRIITDILCKVKHRVTACKPYFIKHKNLRWGGKTSKCRQKKCSPAGIRNKNIAAIHLYYAIIHNFGEEMSFSYQTKPFVRTICIYLPHEAFTLLPFYFYCIPF